MNAPCFERQDVFFPDPPGRGAPKRDRDEAYAPAKQICETCPHTGLDGLCRAEWDEAGQPVHGVWFGRDPYELQQLRRRRRTPNAVPDVHRDEIRERADAAGWTVSSLASAYRVDTNTIRRILKEAS